MRQSRWLRSRKLSCRCVPWPSVHSFRVSLSQKCGTNYQVGGLSYMTMSEEVGRITVSLHRLAIHSPLPRSAGTQPLRSAEAKTEESIILVLARNGHAPRRCTPLEVHAHEMHAYEMHE